MDSTSGCGCCSRFLWKTALNGSVVGCTAALALGWVRQPMFITQHARGPLLLRASYLKGLKWGLLTAPATFVVAWIAGQCTPICCLPCNLAVAWTSQLASGQCCGMPSGDCNPVAIVTDVLGRLLALGLLVGVQGYLMSKRWYPHETSAFCGFFQGTGLIGLAFDSLRPRAQSSRHEDDF